MPELYGRAGAASATWHRAAHRHPRRVARDRRGLAAPRARASSGPWSPGSTTAKPSRSVEGAFHGTSRNVVSVSAGRPSAAATAARWSTSAAPIPRRAWAGATLTCSTWRAPSTTAAQQVGRRDDPTPAATHARPASRCASSASTSPGSSARDLRHADGGERAGRRRARCRSARRGRRGRAGRMRAASGAQVGRHASGASAARSASAQSSSSGNTRLRTQASGSRSSSRIHSASSRDSTKPREGVAVGLQPRRTEHDGAQAGVQGDVRELVGERRQLAERDHVVAGHLGATEALGVHRADRVGGGLELLLAHSKQARTTGLVLQVPRDLDSFVCCIAINGSRPGVSASYPFAAEKHALCGLMQYIGRSGPVLSRGGLRFRT